MTNLAQIAASLEEMRKEVAELRRREAEVAREAALEAQLKRIVEAMQPIGALRPSVRAVRGEPGSPYRLCPERTIA